MADLSEIFSGLLGAAGQYTIGSGAADSARASGALGQQQLQDISSNLSSGLEFRPFTVTTGTGSNVATNATGGFGLNLSGTEQNIQNNALFGANQFLQAGQSSDPALQAQRDRINQLFNTTAGQINPNVSQTTQGIFDQLQSIVSPEQQRQRLALEERLMGQGRTGVRTAAYGGTPEQLAMEKAIQEQTSSNALTARTQALSEQDRLFNLLGGTAGLGTDLASAGQTMQANNIGMGGNMLNAGYNPQAQALQALGYGTNLSEIGAKLQQQSGVTQAQLGMGGVESLMQGQQLGTEWDAMMNSSIIDSLTRQNANKQSVGGSLIDLVGGIFGGDSGNSITGLPPELFDLLVSTQPYGGQA